MIIVKIGGGAGINLPGIVRDLAGLDERFIVVHGANALRDALGERLGTPRKVITSLSGYTSVFSDEKAIDLMMMAYAGLRNKRIVELCLQNGIRVVGLTGLDGCLVKGRRNKGIRVREQGRKKMVRDFSGKPESINTGFLSMLIEHNYTPVITVPIVDENGFAVNTENDDVVGAIAKSMDAERIIQLIEAPGLLKDPDDPETLIESMTFKDCALLKERAEGRMKRKLLAIEKLGADQNTTVQIGDGRVESPVKDALDGKGTSIRN